MNGKPSSRKRKNLDMESQVTNALKCSMGYVYLAANENGNGYLFVVTGEMKAKSPGRKDRVHIMYITGPAIGERQSITVEDWNDAIKKSFIVGPIKLPDIWTWSDEKMRKMRRRIRKMARKKNEESVKDVWDKLPEEEKEKISKELEEAASKLEPYSMDDVIKSLDKAFDGFSERMDQLCKSFADIFCGEEQEEEKMEPTSKQVINGVNAVEIYQEPVCESTRLTLKNNDDSFEIEINGREAYEFFRRLIFNDHNCNEVRKKNQKLADEIVALRRAKDKEILGLREDKEYAEKLNKDLIDRWQERYGNILEENKLLKTENQNLREDIMRVKGQLLELAPLKRMKIIRDNSAFGFGPAPKKPLTRSDILKMADKCTNGQREQDYGTPENNFQLIADIWNAICKTDIFTPELVALCMIGMKSARIVSGGGTGDSWVDICGYAACGGEINARRKQTEKPVSKGK